MSRSAVRKSKARPLLPGCLELGPRHRKTSAKESSSHTTFPGRRSLSSSLFSEAISIGLYITHGYTACWRLGIVVSSIRTPRHLLTHRGNHQPALPALDLGEKQLWQRAHDKKELPTRQSPWPEGQIEIARCRGRRRIC